MKAAIVTQYYKSTNYGGNLQAYAMCKAVEKCGCEAEQLCFPHVLHNLRKEECSIRERIYKFIIRTCRAAYHLLTLGRRLRARKMAKKREQVILPFNQNMIKHSERLYTESDISQSLEKYDCFITGSDLVWCPEWYSPILTLEFVPQNVPKFSYAPSMGVTSLTDSEKELYRKFLNSYQAVSARESSAVALLEELTGTDVEWVLDPTLLFKQEDWDEICGERVIKEPYLFCYFLGTNAASRKAAENYARKHKLKLVTLPYVYGVYLRRDYGFGDVQIVEASPSDFISLIRYADCIFTDSFHACVFSFLYKKQFYAFRRDENDNIGSRIYSLLKLTGCLNRYCDTSEKEQQEYIENLQSVNYNASFDKFELARKTSWDYLKKNLTLAEKRIAGDEIMTEKQHSIIKEGNKISEKVLVEIKNKGDCSGCHACETACPKKAITMKADAEGFLYPDIDYDKCIDCGLCGRMCQAINPIETKRTPCAYACRNNDEAVQLSSSSGGVFYALAEWIIQKGGTIFGAAFDDSLMVRHIAINSVDEIHKLQGSKYVQSVIGDSFAKAKSLLDEGKYVLFTGTPCQIDGLLHYLRKDYDKLYTQDIVCHGVPSPSVWQSYLDYQKNQFGSVLKKTPAPSFRQKENGWRDYSVSLQFDNGTKYTNHHQKDFYIQAFLYNLSLRPSCYVCHSKTKQKNSDITLADFWGVENVCPDMLDDRGTSLVLANSDKGKSLFEEIKPQITCKEVDFESAISHNPSAFCSSARPWERERFFAQLKNKRFDRLVKGVLLPRKTYLKIRRCIFAILRRG